MLRLRTLRLIVLLPVWLAVLMPMCMSAQDDPNDAPLGDVARTLRKKTPPSKAVIDDDNLPQVMEQAESHHAQGSALKFLMTGAANSFRVSAPDVTCSLAFTANVKSLLSNQYAQMDLPASDLHKLEGPATIDGDALILAVYNKTDWHVSEVTVALTVVKKAYASQAIEGANYGVSYGAKLFTAGALGSGSSPQESEARPEKQSDVTVIYRIRAPAPPSATTVFSTPLNLEIGNDEEWHWAIVQARGYPPQSHNGPASQGTAQTGTSIQPTLPFAPATETGATASPPQVPQ